MRFIDSSPRAVKRAEPVRRLVAKTYPSGYQCPKNKSCTDPDCPGLHETRPHKFPLLSKPDDQIGSINTSQTQLPKNADFITLTDNWHEPKSQTFHNVQVLTSPNMIVSYQRFGQCCWLYIEKQIRSLQGLIGGIMGYDFNQQLCLFGLFKISELSSNSIEKLLRVFLTYAKVHPKALFTQFLPEMEVAFENMRKQSYLTCLHLLDAHSVINSMKLPAKSLLKKQLSLLVYVRESDLFFLTLQAMKDELVSNQQSLAVLEEFIELSDRTCFSQIEPVFIGSFQDLTERQTKNKSLMQIFHRKWCEMRLDDPQRQVSNGEQNLKELAQEFSSHYPKRNVRNDEVYLKLPQMRKIYQELVISESLYDLLLSNVLLTPALCTRALNEETFMVISSRTRFYVVRLQETRWQCECHYSVKTGLPCAHELAICLQHKQSIMRQIDQYWGNEVIRKFRNHKYIRTMRLAQLL